MGLLADYITHHNEITEIKFFDENGLAKFLKVESYDKEKIKIGDKLILKVDERLDVKNYCICQAKSVPIFN